MDREKLFRRLDQRYASKREMVSLVPLGIQTDALWRELMERRRSKCTMLPLTNSHGSPYWYVITEKMVEASEKIVDTLFEADSEFDPYTTAVQVSTLEEVFFTSYVEGAQISIQEAMDFLTGELPPRDIEEQIITNNRQASTYAGASLFRHIDSQFLKELISILTDGMDSGGADYRETDVVDYVSATGEPLSFPPPRTIPDHLGALFAYLEDPKAHPLIKAAVAQAYTMILRPFPEGNERLGRLLSSIVLLRAGYTFFSEVSLSALIARKGYGYYAAIENILRDENGCDLTYFIDYFLELLSRAIDERQLRINRKEEQARQAEMEMARTVLSPGTDQPPPYHEPPGRAVAEREVPAASPIQAFQEVMTVNSLDGFEQVPMAEFHGRAVAQEPKLSGIPLLLSYAEKPNMTIGVMARFVIDRLNDGNLVFTVWDICTDLGMKPKQFSSSIRVMKENGIIEEINSSKHNKTYRIIIEKGPERIVHSGQSPPAMEHEPPEPECSQWFLARVDELVKSNSQKDKRIGAFLSEFKSKGVITLEDYAERGEGTKWSVDIQFAAQLGLVKKVSPREVVICTDLEEGPPALSKAQKQFAMDMYESFGCNVFSADMVIATLDYSGPQCSAYLHQLTLLRVLDCWKDGIFRYQFLISPPEHPDWFDVAA